MIGGCVHLRLFWGDAETCYSRTNRRTGKVGLSTPRTEDKENRTIVITCLVTFYVPPCNFIFKRKQSFGPGYKFQFFSKDQCEAPLTRSQNLSLLQKLDWKEVRLIVVNTIRALKDIRAQECILPRKKLAALSDGKVKLPIPAKYFWKIGKSHCISQECGDGEKCAGRPKIQLTVSKCGGSYALSVSISSDYVQHFFISSIRLLTLQKLCVWADMHSIIQSADFLSKQPSVNQQRIRHP